MFGLSKLKNASKNFHNMGLENLNLAKDNSSENNKLRHEKFQDDYKEAVLLLNSFTKNPDSSDSIPMLKYSAEKLIDALKYVKNNPEPYLLLGYIFYIIDEKLLAIKYLQLYESFSEGKDKLEGQKLKNLILEIKT